MHGLIEPQTMTTANGDFVDICRFSSPFIQNCLYDALSESLIGGRRLPILALDPLDGLDDVFKGRMLDLRALLDRYKNYLQRLKDKKLNPWQAQPRRKTDHQLTEAVGHFHLYAWLKEALGRRCVVSPEFPTGNGKVDLHYKVRLNRALSKSKASSVPIN